MNATPSPKTLSAQAAKPAELPAAAPPAAAAPAPRRKRRGLMLALPVALAVGAAGYWLTGGRYESTENAYLHQARISIASSIAGRVVSVDITDNEQVKVGQPLFQVDPEPYRLALAEAEAALSDARLSVEQLKLSYQRARSEVRAGDRRREPISSRNSSARRPCPRAASSTDTALDDARHAARQADEQLGPGATECRHRAGGAGRRLPTDRPMPIQRCRRRSSRAIRRPMTWS